MARKLNYHRQLTAKAMTYAIAQIQALPLEWQETRDMESMCQHVLEELGETNAARMALDVEAHTNRRVNLFPWKGIDKDEELKALRFSYATEYWKEAARREEVLIEGGSGGMKWGFDPITGAAMGIDNFTALREKAYLERVSENINRGRISPAST